MALPKGSTPLEIAHKHDDKILSVLRKGDRSLGQIVDLTGINKRTVIRRVKHLLTTKLVVKQGRLYTIDPQRSLLLTLKQEVLDIINEANEDFVCDISLERVRAYESIYKLYKTSQTQPDLAEKTINFSTGVYAFPAGILHALDLLNASKTFHKYLLMYILAKVLARSKAYDPLDVIKDALPRGKQVVGIVIDYNMIRKHLNRKYFEELMRIGKIEKEKGIASKRSKDSLN